MVARRLQARKLYTSQWLRPLRKLSISEETRVVLISQMHEAYAVLPESWVVYLCENEHLLEGAELVKRRAAEEAEEAENVKWRFREANASRKRREA